jgi:anti-sigma B factor antagonist
VRAASYVGGTFSSEGATPYPPALEFLMQIERTFDAQLDHRFALLLDLDGGRDPDVPRVVLSGEVDALIADQLREAVVEVLSRQRPRHIEIDLDGVTFLDSAGIRALLGCHADAEQADCRLTVTAPRPGAYRVLEITGLLEYLGVVG